MRKKASVRKKLSGIHHRITGRILPYKIRRLAPANPENERGKRTWEYNLELLASQVAIFYRIKGECFGDHFHKGDDPSRNPERLVVLSGKLEFYMKESPKDGWKREILDASNGPIEMEMSPWILHKARALTDVYFIEARPIPFDPNKSDCYPEKMFVDHQKPYQAHS